MAQKRMVHVTNDGKRDVVPKEIIACQNTPIVALPLVAQFTRIQNDTDKQMGRRLRNPLDVCSFFNYLESRLSSHTSTKLRDFHSELVCVSQLILGKSRSPIIIQFSGADFMMSFSFSLLTSAEFGEW